MKYLVQIFLCLLTYSTAYSQSNYSVTGKVLNNANEGIYHAIIQYDSNSAFTDEKGEFGIQYNGNLILKISAIGFEDLVDTLHVNQDMDVVYLLNEVSHEIGQVVIEEEARRHENTKSLNKIETSEIKLIPSAAGVSDIYSTLKTQPGVQSNTEGQKGLVIRGGNYDQSTTYVDGVPVVGSSHLFGLLSMFQTDCIENVKLFNGYKPVKYGATLGPAIEINLKEEFSPEKVSEGSVMSSFLSTQVQSKVSNENSFFQFGLRNSNLFLIQDLINQAVNNNEARIITPVYSFSDVSFKASYLLNNHKFQFLYLKSSDGVDYNIDFVGEERIYLNTMSWNNDAASVNWSYYAEGGATFNAELVSNTYNSLLYSNHRITYFDTELNDQIWRNSLSEFDNTIDNLKSTITVNIAITLAEMGCKVGILDADIYGPSIPTMLDIEGSKPLSVNVEGKSKMKPIENYGLKVLSIGFFTKPDQAVIWRGPMASKALNQMIFDAAWGELDFLLVDLPPGTGDIHLSIVQSLPLNGAIVVSTPQNVALSDAKKGIAMFQQESIKVPVLGIVENMSYFTPDELPDNKYYIFGKKGAEYLANDKNVPFLGGVPIIQSIREASDFGHPVALQKNTELAEKFKLISRNLVSQLIKRNKSLPPTKAVKITNMVGCDAIK